MSSVSSRRHIVAVSVFHEVGVDLLVLCHQQVLVFKYLSVLRRVPLHQLVDRVFDLRRKVAENEVVIRHDFVHLFGRQLEFKWKVVLDRSHFAQLQELVDFGPVFAITVGSDKKITNHFLLNLFHLSKLVDIKHFVLFQVLGDQDSYLHFVDYTNL